MNIDTAIRTGHVLRFMELFEDCDNHEYAFSLLQIAREVDQSAPIF